MKHTDRPRFFSSLTRPLRCLSRKDGQSFMRAFLISSRHQLSTTRRSTFPKSYIFLHVYQRTAFFHLYCVFRLIYLSHFLRNHHYIISIYASKTKTEHVNKRTAQHVVVFFERTTRKVSACYHKNLLLGITKTKQHHFFALKLKYTSTNIKSTSPLISSEL